MASVFAHPGNQLRGADQQQPEGKFKACDVIDIEQRNAQALFAARPALLTFGDDFGPLAGQARIFIERRELVFSIW